MTDHGTARARLLAARPYDEYLRVETEGRTLADVVVRDGCVGWITRHWAHDRDWSTVLGDDATDVAEVAAELVVAGELAGRRTYGLTVSRVGADAVTAGLPWSVGGEWEWWLTTRAPGDVRGEELVRELAADDPRLPPLLEQWSPRRSVEARDEGIRRWVGITDSDRLVAAAADTRHSDDVPHLAGVVTDGAYRGRGYAAAVCARLTRDALADGAPLVTLAMYSDNDAARAVYTRLGFTAPHTFSSGRLHPPVDGGSA